MQAKIFLYNWSTYLFSVEDATFWIFRYITKNNEGLCGKQLEVASIHSGEARPNGHIYFVVQSCSEGGLSWVNPGQKKKGLKKIRESLKVPGGALHACCMEGLEWTEKECAAQKWLSAIRMTASRLGLHWG